MHCFGIGNDIIEVERIRRAYLRFPEKFLSTLFTEQESAYCLKKKDPAIHLAGRFAAKEAVVKALGTGFSNGTDWLDIEVRNSSTGKPEVFLSKALQKKFPALTIHLSISHCKLYASAVAICFVANPA